MNITVIVVLYKQKLEECSTFRTLAKTLLQKNEYLANIHFIFYDNSPQKQSVESFHQYEANISYIHDERNLGIVTAYNYAYETACQNRSEWLLLLDHDTEITEEYVDKILQLQNTGESIAAIVPKINYQHEMISPVYSHSLRPLSTEKPTEGIQIRPVMAINSGSILRISFLDEVGGFNTEFPLDYLDHWIFYEIYSRNYQVLLLDVVLEHDLSVMDYSRVSLQRYHSILDAEVTFYKKYKTDLYKEYKLQLFKRFLKQLLLVKNKKIAFYTLRRLFSLRKGSKL